MTNENELVGWIAFYNGKKLEITKGKDATSLYSAKVFAIKQLRVPKSKEGLLAIEPGYSDNNCSDCPEIKDCEMTNCTLT